MPRARAIVTTRAGGRVALGERRRSYRSGWVRAINPLILSEGRYKLQWGCFVGAVPFHTTLDICLPGKEPGSLAIYRVNAGGRIEDAHRRQQRDNCAPWRRPLAFSGPDHRAQWGWPISTSALFSSVSVFYPCCRKRCPFTAAACILGTPTP